MPRKLSVCAALVVAALAGHAAAVQLPAVFGDHMVVQRDAPWNIAGTDVAGAVVTATFAGNKYTAKADSSGAFTIGLPATAGSLPPTPYTITITSSAGGPTAAINDLVFGDVFLCSGQSNMELSIIATVNQSAVIAGSGAYGSVIRIVQVALEASYINATTPQSDLVLSIPWGAAAPTNVGGMSAMCYFTATALVDEGGIIDAPIGLIDSSWGGTPIEVSTVRAGAPTHARALAPPLATGGEGA